MKLFKSTKRYYFLFSCLFFLIEALIATLFSDSFVRPILGDYLIVILLYCLVRTFTNLTILKAAFGVLLFAYTVEVLQWIDLMHLLGLKKNLLTHLTLGSTFDWNDILAYTLGILTVLIIEKLRVFYFTNPTKKDKI